IIARCPFYHVGHPATSASPPVSPDRAPRLLALFFSGFPDRRLIRVGFCRIQVPLCPCGTGNAYRKGEQGEKATNRSAIVSSTRLLRGRDASGIMLPSRKRT